MSLNFLSKKRLIILGILALIVISVLAAGPIRQKLNPSNISSSDTTEQISLDGFDAFMVGGFNESFRQSKFTPAGLSIPDQKIADVAAGGHHVLVMSEEGQVYSMGKNEEGQLGFKTDSEVVTKLTKIDLPKVAKIAASQHHSVILTEEGEVFTFGGNYTGQLGSGDNNSRSEPGKVQNLRDVKDIAAGYKFSLALKNDGTLWGWGTSCSPEAKAHALEEWEEHHGNTKTPHSYYNPSSMQKTEEEEHEEDEEYEDCINEEVTGIQSKVPVQIQGVSDIKAMAGGYGHILLLKNDGTVWAFGCNKFGQLGNGTIANQVSFAKPYQIQELSDITAISAGFRHSLALKSDGTVWAFGHNEFGELGNNSVTTSGTPVLVEGVKDVKNIFAGHDYSIVQRNDGKLVGWGNNYFNQLGNWGPGYSQVPGEIKELPEVSIKKVSPGGTALVFLKD